MFIEQNDKLALPESIDYLFDNIIMDIVSFLCILSCLRKKRISLDELLFYYTLTVSRIDLKFENKTFLMGTQNAKYEANSLYLYMKDNILLILLYLSNNNLLLASNEVIGHSNQIILTITKNGSDCVAKLKHQHFINLMNRAKYVMKNVKYTITNKNMLFRGEYYDINEIE
jgi:hypothetical protein